MDDFAVSPEEYLVRSKAADYGVDPDHMARLAHAESAFNPSALSPKGAVGVMQLMPGTAKTLGVDPHDTSDNIEGGVKYFSQLLQRYDGDYRKATAAYNAGPGRVDSGKPLPKETQDYVSKVSGPDFKVSPEDYLSSLNPSKTNAVSDFKVSPEDYAASTQKPPSPDTSGLTLPPVPKPPLPVELQNIKEHAPLSQGIVDPKTGIVYQPESNLVYPSSYVGETQARELPEIPSAVTGIPRVAQGLSQMRGATSGRELAGGASSVLGGVLESATPLMGMGLSAPIETALTLGLSNLGSEGTHAVLKKLDVPEEYNSLASDLVGLAVGAGVAHGTGVLTDYVKNEAFRARLRSFLQDKVNAEYQAQQDQARSASQEASQPKQITGEVPQPSPPPTDNIQEGEFEEVHGSEKPTTSPVSPEINGPEIPKSTVAEASLGNASEPVDLGADTVIEQAAIRGPERLTPGYTFEDPLRGKYTVTANDGKYVTYTHEADGVISDPQRRPISVFDKMTAPPSVSEQKKSAPIAALGEQPSTIPVPDAAPKAPTAQPVSLETPSPEVTTAAAVQAAPAILAPSATQVPLPANAPLVRHSTQGPLTEESPEWNNPRGVYFSHDIPNFQSPHEIQGKTTTYRAQSAGTNTLDVRADALKPAITDEDKAEQYDPGVAALRKLLPAKEFSAAVAMDPKQLQTKVQGIVGTHQIPSGAWRVPQELLSMWGAHLARQAGYDAIIGHSTEAGGGEPAGIEYVALKPSAISERPSTAVPGTVHKFSSTQLNLPSDLAKAAQSHAATIDDGDLAEDGRETEPHITVRWGLHDEAPPQELRDLLGKTKEIKVRFGKTSIFKGQNPGDPDVVKVNVGSPALQELNAKIGRKVDNTQTHASYSPHVTLGYVQAGKGEKYAGKDVPGLTGKTEILNSLTFLGKNGAREDIRLAQAPGQADQVEATKPSVNDTERGSAPMLGDLAQATHDFIKNGNYSVAGAVETAARRNLGQLKRVSEAAKDITVKPAQQMPNKAAQIKENERSIEEIERKLGLTSVHSNALRAASPEARTSAMIRAAIPLIRKTLLGTDLTPEGLFNYYIDSRLQGIRKTWGDLADGVEKMSDEDLADAFDDSGKDDLTSKDFRALIGNLEGKKGIPEPPAQVVASYVEAGDWHSLREYLADTFRAAQSSVIHHMQPDEFDFIRDLVKNDPKVKEADRIYHDTFEAPIGQNHAMNEGIMATNLGPAGRYFPLMSAAEDKNGGGFAERLGWKVPGNQQNRMATGLSSKGYTTDISKLRRRIYTANDASARATFLRSAMDGGLMRTVKRGEVAPETFSFMGKDYPNKRVTIGQAKLIIKDGKTIQVPAPRADMPNWFYEEVRDIVDEDRRKPVTPGVLQRIGTVINGISIELGSDIPYHTVNQIAGLELGTPFVGKTLAEAGLSTVDFTKHFYLIGKLMTVDPAEEESVKAFSEMADVGALHPRYASVTYSKQFAKDYGAKLVRWNLSPLLYGPKGMEARGRYLMWQVAKTINPNMPPAELNEFVNQVGNYTPKLWSKAMRWMKATPLSPFATAGDNMIWLGLNGIAGTGPMITPGPGKAKWVPNSKAQLRLWQIFGVSAIAAIARWVMMYKAATGQYPTRDPRSKLMAIPIGGSNGPIDKFRHTHLGDWLFGKNENVGYVYLYGFNPGLKRGLAATGIPALWETKALGGTWGQAFEKANVQTLDTLAHPLLGPIPRAAVAGLFGKEAYLTDIRDQRGRFSLEMMPAISSKTPPGWQSYGKRAMAAGMQMNGFFANAGEMAGVRSDGAEDPNRDNGAMARTLLNYSVILSGFAGAPSNPERKAERLQQQLAGTAPR